jgi:hypothetical protein
VTGWLPVLELFWLVRQLQFLPAVYPSMPNQGRVCVQSGWARGGFLMVLRWRTLLTIRLLNFVQPLRAASSAEQKNRTVQAVPFLFSKLSDHQFS